MPRPYLGETPDGNPAHDATAVGFGLRVPALGLAIGIWGKPKEPIARSAEANCLFLSRRIRHRP